MPNLRAIVTVAVPAVTALLGLLWFLTGKKRPPNQRKLDKPPDKENSSENETVAKSGKNLKPNGAEAANDISKDVKLDDRLKSFLNENSIHQPMGKGDASEDSVRRAIEAQIVPSVLLETEHRGPSGSSARRQEANADVSEPIVSATVTRALSSSLQTKNMTAEPGVIVTEVIEKASHCQPVETAPITAENHQYVAQQIEMPADIEGTLASQIIVSAAAVDEKPSVEEDNIKVVRNCKLDASPESSFLNKKTVEPSQHDNESGLACEDTVNKDSVLEFDTDVLTSQSNESMSRSWHEEVDETCGFNDMDVALCTNSLEEPSDSYSTSKTDRKSSADRIQSSPSRADRTKLSPSRGRESKTPERKLSTSPVHTSNEISSVKKRKDESQNSSDSSSNCDNLSEASSDSGKGGSVAENHQNTSPSLEERIFEFNIPSDLCGLFIGSRGKTIKTIREQSGTRIRLRNNPYTAEYQICVVEGPKDAVDRALDIIRRKFPNIKYPGMDLNSISAPVITSEIMQTINVLEADDVAFTQLSLPEGVMVDVVVSSIVDAGRVFVQQPTHPSFPSLDRLNAFMSQCYITEGSVPDIPRPIESGVICAAPMLNGWYRAEIMAYYDDSDECDIKYVDYGGYTRIKSECLKQIRSDFMTLPFEAVECYLANITPVDDTSYFSTEAAVVLEELTQGKLLQVQVVGHAEDGLPFVLMYQIGPVCTMVNRELVNRGVARWVEAMS